MVLKTLAGGGILIYPTETLYGIGCNPFAPGQPAGQISAIKERPADQPFIFLIPDILFLEENGLIFPPATETWANHFWPGPLTIILSVPDTSPLSKIAWKTTLAVRVSSHPFVRALFKHRRFPLVSTSANISGADENAARDPGKIKEIFSSHVDLFITEGYKEDILPSTILDLTSRCPEVLREGAIKISELASVHEI